MSVTPTKIPDDTALARYAAEGHYADCFAVTVAGDYSLPDFVRCFYRTPLFRTEAALLGIFAARPSKSADADALAMGASDRFSAWTVEVQTREELMMCDMSGHTRSWFSVVPGTDETTLLFGSVVVANKKTGKHGWLFHALLPFHAIYARALLWSAARRIKRA